MYTYLVFDSKFFFFSTLCCSNPSDIHDDVDTTPIRYRQLHSRSTVTFMGMASISSRLLINTQTFTSFLMDGTFTSMRNLPKNYYSTATLRHTFNTITTYLPSHSHKLPIRLEHRCLVES